MVPMYDYRIYSKYIHVAGYEVEEVQFDGAMSIDDVSIKETNELVCRQFGVKVEQLDWRDPATLWIHPLTSD